MFKLTFLLYSVVSSIFTLYTYNVMLKAHYVFDSHPAYAGGACRVSK